MKKIVLSISLIYLLLSCTEIKFEQPQPKRIKNLELIPEKIQGEYLLDKKDTIKISSEQILILKDSLGLEDEVYKLSDVFKVRYWKKTYFLNIKEKEDSVWTVIFIQKNKNQTLSMGFLSFEEKDTESIEKIKSITKLKEVMNESESLDYYLANPSRCELKKLMKQANFHELISLEKIK